MRTMGRNMAWMILCIEAGKAAGITRADRPGRAGQNQFHPIVVISSTVFRRGRMPEKGLDKLKSSCYAHSRIRKDLTIWKSETPRCTGSCTEILKLYAEAKSFHAGDRKWHASGEPSYPPVEQIEADIRAGKSYVCEADGVSWPECSIFQRNPIRIMQRFMREAGLGPRTYHVMHRVAAPGRVKGAGSFCIHWCAEHSQWRFAD